MAIALGIGLVFIIGVTVMFQTQYFWGKESNENINTINCTISNVTGSFGTGSFLLVIVVVVVLAAAMLFLCTARGFA